MVLHQFPATDELAREGIWPCRGLRYLSRLRERSDRASDPGEGLCTLELLAAAPHPLATLATSPRKRGEVARAARES